MQTVDGEILHIPKDWELLPPGDAALSRRIKKIGPAWTVKVLHRRRWVSQGIWAPKKNLIALRKEREKELRDPAYQKKLDAGRLRRKKEQAHYAADFERAVRDYLAFAPRHEHLERKMARAIAQHAVPVGSGTVARTKRLAIEQKAQAATIA